MSSPLAFILQTTGEIGPVRLACKSINDIENKDVDMNFECDLHMIYLSNNYFLLCHVENDDVLEICPTQPENLAWKKVYDMCSFVPPFPPPSTLYGTAMLVQVDGDDNLVDYEWNWTDYVDATNAEYEDFDNVDYDSC